MPQRWVNVIHDSSILIIKFRRAFNYILIQFQQRFQSMTQPVKPLHSLTNDHSEKHSIPDLHITLNEQQIFTPQKPTERWMDARILNSEPAKKLWVMENQKEETTKGSRENKYTGCNCSKSQCLKMYCACFSVGKMCDETCLCQSCKNQTDNMQRSEAINQIIVKDPYAFSRKQTLIFSEDTCNCKKSGCLKKYCDCFRKGKSCGKNCNCLNCQNCNVQQQKETQQKKGAAKVKIEMN